MYFDFVQPVLSLYFNCCFIKSFVNIFVDIFYGLDCGVDLDINMSIVFIGEIWIVKDNKTVIKMDLLFIDGADYKLVVIILAVDWVAVVGHLGFVCKRLWKAFYIL